MGSKMVHLATFPFFRQLASNRHSAAGYLKSCSNCLTPPAAEKNMFVVSFAPEHN